MSETGHFGRAAKATFVSQSAFSAAIRELETVLGTQLVDRTNRQVTITATGAEIVSQARLCLREVEALVELAGRRRKPLSGDLRLGVIPSIAPFLLPELLPRLRRDHPELRLYLAEDQTVRLHERLLHGELDLILLALPYDLRGVETLELFRDRFRLACREGTARVDPRHYRYSQLDAGSVLLLEDGHWLRDHSLTACKIRNTEKVSRFAANSLLTLVEMVDADLGITFLPEMAEGSSILKKTRVRLYPLQDSSYRTIGLAWRKGSARDEEFRLLGMLITRSRPK